MRRKPASHAWLHTHQCASHNRVCKVIRVENGTTYGLNRKRASRSNQLYYLCDIKSIVGDVRWYSFSFVLPDLEEFDRRATSSQCVSAHL